MRQIGFSTGSLALGDFRRALEMLESKPVSAVELSALRDHELAPLLAALDSLDLSQFGYVSVHCPSRFNSLSEEEAAARLEICIHRKWPVVIHPDAIKRYDCWSSYGPLLCVENMDKRKPTGRTVDELEFIFENLREGSFCLDVGHARQIDPTMTQTEAMLRRFGSRLRQIHLSEVNSLCEHRPLSLAAVMAVRRIGHLIPVGIPVILESPVSEDGIETEISRAREALAGVVLTPVA